MRVAKTLACVVFLIALGIGLGALLANSVSVKQNPVVVNASSQRPSADTAIEQGTAKSKGVLPVETKQGDAESLVLHAPSSILHPSPEAIDFSSPEYKKRLETKKAADAKSLARQEEFRALTEQTSTTTESTGIIELLRAAVSTTESTTTTTTEESLPAGLKDPSVVTSQPPSGRQSSTEQKLNDK